MARLNDLELDVKKGDRVSTLKQVPKFRKLQVPNFQVPGTSSSEILKKNVTIFFPISTKNILDRLDYCLLPFHAL